MYLKIFRTRIYIKHKCASSELKVYQEQNTTDEVINRTEQLRIIHCIIEEFFFLRDWRWGH